LLASLGDARARRAIARCRQRRRCECTRDLCVGHPRRARIHEVRSQRARHCDAMRFEVKPRCWASNLVDPQVDQVVAKGRAPRLGIFGFLVRRACSQHQRNSDPFAPHAITTKGFDRDP